MLSRASESDFCLVIALGYRIVTLAQSSCTSLGRARVSAAPYLWMKREREALFVKAWFRIYTRTCTCRLFSSFCEIRELERGTLSDTGRVGSPLPFDSNLANMEEPYEAFTTL